MNDVEIKISKHTLNGIPLKEKKDDKEVKYDIELQDNQTIKFDKLEDKKKGKTQVRIKYKKTDDKDWSAEKTVDLICKKSIWRTTFYLDPNLDTGVVLKEESNQRVKTNKHTLGWGFYGAIVFAVLVIGGLIWWWISSSKKEDKEEESL